MQLEKPRRGWGWNSILFSTLSCQKVRSIESLFIPPPPPHTHTHTPSPFHHDQLAGMTHSTSSTAVYIPSVLCLSPILLVCVPNSDHPNCFIMQLLPKAIGNRKRDCAWGCARGINTTWEICRSKSTNQSGERNERLPDLCFSICRFSQVVFIPRAQPRAQSLFLFPIVFGINLIHFSMRRRTVQPEIRSFVSSLRSRVTPFDRS